MSRRVVERPINAPMRRLPGQAPRLLASAVIAVEAGTEIVGGTAQLMLLLFRRVRVRHGPHRQIQVTVVDAELRSRICAEGGLAPVIAFPFVGFILRDARKSELLRMRSSS